MLQADMESGFCTQVFLRQVPTNGETKLEFCARNFFTLFPGAMVLHASASYKGTNRQRNKARVLHTIFFNTEPGFLVKVICTQVVAHKQQRNKARVWRVQFIYFAICHPLYATCRFCHILPHQIHAS